MVLYLALRETLAKRQIFGGGKICLFAQQATSIHKIFKEALKETDFDLKITSIW